MKVSLKDEKSFGELSCASCKRSLLGAGPCMRLRADFTHPRTGEVANIELYVCADCVIDAAMSLAALPTPSSKVKA